MTDQYTKASPSLHKEISHQLKLILASPDFNATPQQIALLKYVVNQTRPWPANPETLRMRPSRPMYSVEGQQRIDPIVSIQADQLRRALVRYYETTGTNDPIRIDIPKGTYVPMFKKRKLNGP
jgi:hypothetical protein